MLRKPISPELAEYLLDHDRLKAWAHLSLMSRCQMIASSIPIELRMTMSRIHLAKFYRRHGVGYRRPNVKMWGNRDDFTMSCDKLKFILKMTEILQSGAQLIWLDETTVNQWGTRVDRLWQPKDAPFTIRLPERGSSITVYGALFSRGGRLRYATGESTCIPELLTFLDACVIPHLSATQESYLVLDNHTAHHSNHVTAYLKEKRLKTIFIPAYSSELNPVEWVWKRFKDAWHRDMYRRYLDPQAPLHR